jgi:hypothetical protein
LAQVPSEKRLLERGESFEQVKLIRAKIGINGKQKG